MRSPAQEPRKFTYMYNGYLESSSVILVIDFEISSFNLNFLMSPKSYSIQNLCFQKFLRWTFHFTLFTSAKIGIQSRVTLPYISIFWLTQYAVRIPSVLTNYNHMNTFINISEFWIYKYQICNKCHAVYKHIHILLIFKLFWMV